MNKALKPVFLMLAFLFTLLTDCFLLPASAAEPEPTLSTVYLSDAGNDANTGESETQAFRTMDKAMESLGDAGGTVWISGQFTFMGEEYTEAPHSGKVTVTGGTLVFPDKYRYQLGGSTLFEEVTVRHNGEMTFAAAFHPIEFGEKVETVNTGSADTGIYVAGGFYEPEKISVTDLDSHITIRSGSYYAVCGFSRKMKSGTATQTYTGTSHILIEGGEIREVYGAALENHYCANTEITVNGGRIGTVFAAGDKTRRINGDADIYLKGGSVDTVNINNVVGHAGLFLDGGTLGTACRSYGSIAIEGLCANSVLTLQYNSILYSETQVQELGKDFDEIIPFGRVFVKADGTGDGLSETTPTSSLSDAFSLLAHGGGSILILGEYPVPADFQEPAHSSRIVISGSEDSALLFEDNAVYRVNGPLVLESILLNNRGDLMMDADEFSFTSESGCRSLDSSRITVRGREISVHDGSFGRILCESVADLTGGRADQIILNGDSELNVLGGSAGVIYLPDSGNQTVRLMGGSVDMFANHTEKNHGGERTLYYNSLRYTEGQIDGYRPFFDRVEGSRVVFAADDGTGTGSSPTDAVNNLESAIRVLDGEDGSVVICGQLSVTDEVKLPAHRGTVTVTSLFAGIDYRRTNSAQINFSADLTLGGPSRFADITFEMRASSRSIYCNGNSTVFDTGIQVEKQVGVSNYLSVNGGGFERVADNDSYLLILNCGRYNIVRGGNADPLWSSHGGYRASQRNADVTVQVNGGEYFGYFCLAGDGEVSGDFDLTVNDGDFRAGIYGTGNNCAAFSGNLSVALNNGVFRSAIAPATSTVPVLSGNWELDLNGGNFQRVTDVKGTKNFEGNMHSTWNVNPAIDISAQETGTTTFQNYLRSGADPWLFLHDGYYYLTITGGTQISVFKAMNFEDLATAPPIVIFKPEAGQEYSRNLWSPEIHYFSETEAGEENAGWYLYIACDDGDNNNHRLYVLKSLSGTPEGPYGNPETGEENVPVKVKNPDDPEFNTGWCAGQTVLRCNGRNYAMWVDEIWEEPVNGEQRRYQVEYLCEMQTPWILKGQKAMICQPTLDWEKQGATTSGNKIYPEVVEGGTAVYGPNGEVYIIYSGSGYWTTFYSLGQLKLIGEDPLAYDSWEKSPEPIFSKSNEVNGCGHASYTTSPDGKSLWICYHAYTGTDTQSGRFVFVEPYTVGSEGVVVGNGSGHPQPISTEMTMDVNPKPLEEKISGWDNSAEPTEPFPEGIFAAESVSLKGSSQIVGDVGTNAVEAGSVNFAWSAGIDGDLWISPTADPTEVVSGERPDPTENVSGEIRTLPAEREYPLPEFPEFPDPMDKGDLVAGWRPEGSHIIEESGTYGMIDVTNELTVNVGEEDVEIVADRLSVTGNGRILVNRTGNGRLILYVAERLELAGSGKINPDGGYDDVCLYYAGEEALTFGGSTVWTGSLFAEKADVILSGSGAVTGHIVTGGNTVHLSGNGRIDAGVLYAPNAILRVTGSGSIRGVVIVHNLELSGSARIRYDDSIESEPQ